MDNNRMDDKTVMQAAVQKPIDAECRVEVSSDHLHAYLMILPPMFDGADITVPSVMRALREAGVVYGVKLTDVQYMVSEKKYNSKYEIALGTPPVKGEDGTITNRFVFGRRGIPQVNIDGSVNHQELNLIYNVTQGDILCDINPPTDGIKGMAVTGEELAALPGRNARLPIGKNVLVNEDETQLYAGISGNLLERHNNLEIDDVFTVMGDVDNSVGNLNFIGSIVVRGDVKSGFSIQADGDIRVSGMVEGAYVKSKSNILVSCGINGHGTGKVEAGGNLKTSFIENAIVYAAGNIYADSIMYCNLKCDGSLELSGKRASVIGGEYIVTQNLLARNIGSPSRVTTDITLGASIGLVEQQEVTKRRLAQIDDDILRLSQAIAYLGSKDQSTLPKAKLDLLATATVQKEELARERIRIVSTMEEIDSQLAQPNISQITCKGTIYAGTRITIKSSSVILTEDRVSTTVFYADNDIVFGLA